MLTWNNSESLLRKGTLLDRFFSCKFCCRHSNIAICSFGLFISMELILIPYFNCILMVVTVCKVYSLENLYL